MCTENVTKNTPQNNLANLPNRPKYLGYLEKSTCWVNFFVYTAPRLLHGIFTLYLKLLGNPKSRVGTSKFLTMQWVTSTLIALKWKLWQGRRSCVVWIGICPPSFWWMTQGTENHAIVSLFTICPPIFWLLPTPLYDVMSIDLQGVSCWKVIWLWGSGKINMLSRNSRKTITCIRNHKAFFNWEKFQWKTNLILEEYFQAKSISNM